MIAALLLTLAAPLIDRPLNLPAGVAQVELAGMYANWDAGAGSGVSVSGESGAASVAFGLSSGLQLGATVALPLNPGFGFGTVAGTALFALGRDNALRVDAGFERLGANGGSGFQSAGDSYFGGIGAPLRFKLAGNLALVSGHTSGFQFAHYTNLGANGTGLYAGASTFGLDAGDLLTVAHSTGDANASDNTTVNLTLPVGLMVQVAEPFAITFWTGYHLLWNSDGATSHTAHFIPIGVDATWSPTAAFDVGASFNLPGRVGGDLSGGYSDIRDVAVWIRLRTI